MNDNGRLATWADPAVRKAGVMMVRLKRSGPAIVWAGIAGALICCLLVVGCATKSRHEWLTFFFDGVPSPEEPSLTVPEDWEEDAVTEMTPGSDADLRARPRRVQFLHDPYAEKECDSCHKSAYSQQLFGSMTEVCFSCHSDFLSAFTVQHDPAASGECMECHEPHKADVAALLRQPVPAVCYECHDTVTEEEFKHDPAAGGECMECHDPHASDQRALAKLPGSELCYQCHDTVTEEEFKHDPAAGGECTECHNPHASEYAMLLVLEGQALCYECHDEDEVTSGEAHVGMGAESCTACHDPHQGAERYFLKEDWDQRSAVPPTPGAP